MSAKKTKTTEKNPNNLEYLKSNLYSSLNKRSVHKEDIKAHIEECIKSPGIYPWLIDTVLNADQPLNQKLAWLISHLASKDHRIISQHSDQVLLGIQQLNPDGVIRDILRAYVHIPIEHIEHGELTNVCFIFLSEGKRDLAVKYNASRILFKLIKIYPELKPEIIDVLEIQSKIDYSGFGKHAQRFVKNLNQK